MGNGVGSADHYASSVHLGKVICEVAGPKQFSLEALAKIQGALPMKVKIIMRYV
jgi:ribosomal protein L16/L10AE